MNFEPFPKIPRLSRESVITEKLDGSNAQVCIIPRADLTLGSDITAAVHSDDEVVIFAGSRSRWVTPGKSTDNYGFAAWVKENVDELKKLGPGAHFGEWFGLGINRNYGLTERRFALFNVSRWLPGFTADGRPGGVVNSETGERVHCCHVVPLIWRGVFDTRDADNAVEMLRSNGSFAVPGFMRPEGIVVYHCASKQLFKKTLEADESPKGVPGLTNSRQLVAGAEAANEVFHRKLQ